MADAKDAKDAKARNRAPEPAPAQDEAPRAETPPFGAPAAAVAAAPADAPEGAPSEEPSRLRANVLYRVGNSAVQVTRSDGRQSYHAPGSLLLFTSTSPTVESGTLEEVHSAADVRRLGLQGLAMPGYPADDAVRLVSSATLHLARLTLQRQEQRQEATRGR